MHLDERIPQLEGLLAAVAAGDAAGFRALYLATSPKLFGIILRICRERSLAEDVLQDVFLRVWRKAGDFDPASGRALAWLTVIARNAAIDAIRQRQLATARTEPDGEARLATVAVPDEALRRVLDREALGLCLDELDGVQRECVLLAYCDGYSREELGLRFDRPVGTIKTWLHRSLARLKECLERT